MPRIRRAAALTLTLATLALAAPPASRAGSPGSSPGRKFSTNERMTLPRLKALHEDVAALKTRRHEVALKTGLTDFHSILHAHAEDSTHTGGTRPEMLEDAQKAGVQVIMLSDHYRPPKDFINDTWRGMHEGVLFIPGSEIRGFLVYPDHSIMDKMEQPNPEYIATVTGGAGAIFLSHPENKILHPMDGLTGMEIYNNHYDAMDDAVALMGIITKIVDPDRIGSLQDALRLYPAETYAAIVDYPQIYMNKWDKETQKQRVVGVAANDCHHNQVYMSKMVDADTVRVGTNVDADDAMRVMTTKQVPNIAKATAGRQPGDILGRLDFDPYHRSFLNCSTHILATEQTEPAIRAALRAGHVYVAHDWLCRPTGFAYAAQAGDERLGIMGDEITMKDGLRLLAEFPVPCEIHVIHNGEIVSTTESDKLDYIPTTPGVYRIEGWLSVGGESRIWIYSNPIYVKSAL